MTRGQGHGKAATRASAPDFESFYQHGFGRVTRAIGHLAGASAEDVAQEAFLVARDRWDEIRELDAPLAWVRLVATRMAMRHSSRERRRSELEQRLPMTDLSMVRDLDLLRALDELSDRELRAISLHYFEDRPIPETADGLGCSESAAKVLLFRTRRRLGNVLSGLEGRWVSERRWSRDDIVRHLRSAGASEHIGVVLEQELGGEGGRWELTLSKHRYRLCRDDGLRLDEGAAVHRGTTLELIPDLASGHVVLSMSLDAARLHLRSVENDTEPTHGVPDDVFVDLFLNAGPLSWLPNRAAV